MRDYLDFPFEIKASDVTEAGIFKGYASVFGGKADAYGDVIVEGAFKDTLAAGGRNGTGIAMCWQHDVHRPIGTWTSLVEDKKGLKVEGKLTMKSAFVRDEVYPLLCDGAIKGLSIGYDLRGGIAEWDEEKKTRYLKKVNLWEISPVTFPAQTRAGVQTIKAIEEARTERELEEALREAGLSRGSALYVVKLCRGGLRESAKRASLVDVLPKLREINNQLRAG